MGSAFQARDTARTVSDENVEAFERCVVAANSRDEEALLTELHPEVEWHAVLPIVGGDATYRGHDGVQVFLREVWDVLAESRFEFPDVRDLGNRVLALGHFHVVGEASGVETESPFAYVVEFKDAKVFLVRAYLDHSEALEAAGIEE